jgi:hypothetical protein
VWFNDPLTDNDAGPFGGTVHIETEIAPKEWWYPYGG